MQLIECPVLLEHLGNDPRSVLCLDIETTGFFAPDDEILSLSIIDGTNAVRLVSSEKPCVKLGFLVWKHIYFSV